MPFFLSWLRCAYEEHAREMSFRAYLTDAVQAVANNAAHIGGGTVINTRWAEVIDDRRRRDDGRSAEEIIADVIEKAGITVI